MTKECDAVEKVKCRKCGKKKGCVENGEINPCKNCVSIDNQDTCQCA